MFKDNAEPVMWWRINGRHYMELSNGRILISDDGVLWSGGNSMVVQNSTEEGEKMQKTFAYEVKSLLIAYQNLNAKYLNTIEKPFLKVCRVLNGIITILKGGNKKK